ncbi:MAG: 1,4-dihydroxy-2-naphthoate polyprenyltransferase [Bacteroidales bacterium]
MIDYRALISAFRLRTLPLALSSVALGCFLAYVAGRFSITVALLAALTTLFLQILSNLANDYGDSSHGTDNEKRIGPVRAVQSGAITPAQMKKVVILFIVLSLVSGIGLVIAGTKGTGGLSAVFFLLLGLGAIMAAVKYTVGKNPYGYAGFGDLFVFLFFGLAGVTGTYWLHTHTFRWDILLPASAMGFLSTGVLNMNNMRDRENDRESGKYTLVVRMGIEKARWYHLFLLVASVLSGSAYMLLNYHSPFQMLFLITLPMLWINAVTVFRNRRPEELDPWLRKLALTSLLFSLAFGIGLLF